jgi:nucleotide-binding universal stress UspA family protein
VIVLRNILVATDFSEAAAVGLEYGRELARRYDATLHVFHAIDDVRWRYSLDMSAGLLVGVQEDLAAAARASMTALVTAEDRDQLHAIAITEVSMSPSDAIVEYAKGIAADIVIVGTHGRGGLPRAFLGSVAERVVRTAPCPVLTVHRAERGFISPDALVAAEKV